MGQVNVSIAGKTFRMACEDGQVRFTYRDRREGDRQKIATLPTQEFIGRFLKHVLPARFQRIRHYGLLANRGKQQRLARCRELLGVPPQTAAAAKTSTFTDWLHNLLGLDPDRCPCCGNVLRHETLEPQPTPTTTATRGSLAVPPDTS